MILTGEICWIPSLIHLLKTEKTNRNNNVAASTRFQNIFIGKRSMDYLRDTLSIIKTLWEGIFGRGRTVRMILWTCLIAAKQLSSYLTREDKSFTPLVCWTTQLIQYVPIHNKNSVISRQCLKICTSSMQTCLEPNCNIGQKWLQPGE